jgi:hypothetical protein
MMIFPVGVEHPLDRLNAPHKPLKDKPRVKKAKKKSKTRPRK